MPSATTKHAVSAKERRKSDKLEAKVEAKVEPPRPGLVTLTVPPPRLRSVVDPTYSAPVKEETPVKDKESPALSATAPGAAAANPENPSDSTPDTPNPSGTPAPPSVMGPPTEGPKKKGVKRSAAGANGNGDITAKVRGKPGPKKKARLDDGSLDPGRANGFGAHKLGPKANQGAINAGLRALDRSGKPCRKWSKGGFQLKSFTGVVWSIPRWTAPPRPMPEPENGTAASPPQESATASAEGSGSNNDNVAVINNNNKENEQVKSENSPGGADVEMQSAPSLTTDSPAPVPVAAAS